MKISHEGLALIKHFEGLRLKAYYCSAGKLTIGYGSTGKHVKLGMVITEAEANALLTKDLVRFERGVDELAEVELAQHEADALISFAFNLGLANLDGSTLLRKLNAGKRAECIMEFGRWNKARVDGKLVALPGLTKRRAAEAAMFAGDSWRSVL